MLALFYFHNKKEPKTILYFETDLNLNLPFFFSFTTNANCANHRMNRGEKLIPITFSTDLKYIESQSVETKQQKRLFVSFFSLFGYYVDFTLRREDSRSSWLHRIETNCISWDVKYELTLYSWWALGIYVTMYIFGEIIIIKVVWYWIFFVVFWLKNCVNTSVSM